MRDTFGIVPPEIKARLENDEMIDRQAGAGKALDAQVRRDNPDLSVVFIKSSIPPAELPNSALPGRWHIRQQTPLGPRFIPIAWEDSSYREPSWGVYEEFRKRDLTRPGAMADLREATAVEDALKQHDKDLADEQRVDEMTADYKAAKRVAGEGGLTKRKWAKGLVGS